ncbi:Eco47II restriction endonuclease [Flexibacter flexilis DSM 6793]|uniref:Eco47II restriction endonuclease n=1 Tax=Flexibacter flexilis DSM 6793 TaxID=927664 RepID=A0A1I1LUQ4_9BACT|nr:Eco47II family restriction endonuclease [Flexibacter flexilis]SFC74033.1 Eco47II restriction endonuclease [Flexibacter flexilis DSM 6793]
MANKYVNFVSDEHFLNCVANLHKSYLKAKNNLSKKSFYANKIDTIKLTFDAHFNNMSEELLIESEILRQIDKSINNSIGTFHEQILGGIKGFEVGQLSGFDIKAKVVKQKLYFKNFRATPMTTKKQSVIGFRF